MLLIWCETSSRGKLNLSKLKKEPLETPSLLNWNQHIALFQQRDEYMTEKCKEIVVYNSQDKWKIFWRANVLHSIQKYFRGYILSKEDFLWKPFLKILFIVWEILILQFHTTKWSAPYMILDQWTNVT